MAAADWPGGLIPKKASSRLQEALFAPTFPLQEESQGFTGILTLSSVLEKGKRWKIEGKAEPREKELNQLRMERVFFPELGFQ